MPQFLNASTRVKILDPRDENGDKAKCPFNLTGLDGFLAKPAELNSEEFQVQVGPTIWTLPADRVALVREVKKGRAA